MQYKIERKENVTLNNRKATSYRIFEIREGALGSAWHFVGAGFASGHDATDQECIADHTESADSEFLRDWPSNIKQ